MSDIQKQIQDAEVSAVKELDIAIQYLEEKKNEAQKKARDLLASAKKDADNAFIAKKELLDEKLEKNRISAEEALESKMKKLSGSKELVKKGVTFLLSRIA